MRLESRGEKPTDVDALQMAMLKEFVQSDECARAKVRLMEIKMRSSMDEHVSKFKRLVEITEVPENEEYIFFFMSLPGKYIQKMSEKYPSGMPPSDGGMTTVCEDARNWALSMK